MISLPERRHFQKSSTGWHRSSTAVSDYVVICYCKCSVWVCELVSAQMSSILMCYMQQIASYVVTLLSDQLHFLELFRAKWWIFRPLLVLCCQFMLHNDLLMAFSVIALRCKVRGIRVDESNGFGGEDTRGWTLCIELGIVYLRFQWLMCGFHHQVIRLCSCRTLTQS